MGLPISNPYSSLLRLTFELNVCRLDLGKQVNGEGSLAVSKRIASGFAIRTPSAELSTDTFTLGSYSLFKSNISFGGIIGIFAVMICGLVKLTDLKADDFAVLGTGVPVHFRWLHGRMAQLA